MTERVVSRVRDLQPGDVTGGSRLTIVNKEPLYVVGVGYRRDLVFALTVEDQKGKRRLVHWKADTTIAVERG